MNKRQTCVLAMSWTHTYPLWNTNTSDILHFYFTKDLPCLMEVHSISHHSFDHNHELATIGFVPVTSNLCPCLLFSGRDGKKSSIVSWRLSYLLPCPCHLYRLWTPRSELQVMIQVQTVPAKPPPFPPGTRLQSCRSKGGWGDLATYTPTPRKSNL